MATTQKIRNDITKMKEKIAEQQKRLRALEAQLAEEENLEIVRMVKAVHMDNKELFLRKLRLRGLGRNYSWKERFGKEFI